MSDSINSYSAPGPMAGYLYQVRLALLWSIRQSRQKDFVVSIETLDDVSFTADQEPISVLQAKHSLHATATLGDLSSDLWKTLRIWMLVFRLVNS